MSDGKGRRGWRQLLLIVTIGLGLGGFAADKVMAQSPATGDGEMEVSVLFVTNRDLRATEEARKRYGDDRGPLRYGRCTVQFKPLPGVDSLASRLPFYLPDETKALVATEEVRPLEFWPLVTAREAASDPDQKVVILIHGYNFDFERACKRGTELQRLLGGGFSVILFTWPSAGNPVAYSRDETNSAWSVPQLRTFLARATTEIEADSMSLIGHSLGARTLSRALEGLAQRPRNPVLFSELVLSAADVDSGVFEERWSNIRGLARRLTLYASDSDAPLKASRQLHGYPRLGEAGKHLTLLEGAETIDASGTGFFELTGHNYQYFHPLLLADLRELLETGREAEDREHLKASELDGRRFWVLTPPPEPEEEPEAEGEPI